MKSMIYNIRQSKGLRFVLCALAISFAAPVFAQDDDTEEIETSIKQPVRKNVKEVKYPMVKLHGIVLNQADKKPLAGIQLRTLGNAMFTAMTKADGTFEINVPTFTTSLFVHSPSFLSQQVAVNTKDSLRDIRILMLPDAFGEMYVDGTEYTATNSFTANSNSVTIDNDIANKLGGDIHSIMRSAAPDAGASMFIRGLNSLNANAQPLIVVDGIEQDMQQNRQSLHSGQFNNILANISPEDIDDQIIALLMHRFAGKKPVDELHLRYALFRLDPVQLAQIQIDADDHVGAVGYRQGINLAGVCSVNDLLKLRPDHRVKRIFQIDVCLL